MPNCKSFYEPREDSTLLEHYVREYAKGDVLDIGTGSGIQAIAAAHNGKVNSVLAIDVQKSTIDYCKKNIKNKITKFLVSDLFENIKTNINYKNKKFDAIIFNPPYLPDELKVKDLTLEGGRKGYEAMERFLNEVSNFLKPEGIILIVFSSLTRKEKVDEFIKNNLLESELLEKQHYFFEDLYVYKIVKSDLLKKLEQKNIKTIKYFAKGKRGVVFTGIYKNKKIAIKIKNRESLAIQRIENEINFLRRLNKKNIGPKLLFYGNDFLAYEFVEGAPILDFLNSTKNNKIAVLKIIRKIMEQLYLMDKMKINKEEMSHPIKHILVNKNSNPILIDFERCRYTIKPANATQFCDFLSSNNVSQLLKNNKITINKNKIINAAKKYRKEINNKNYKNIVNIIENG